MFPVLLTDCLDGWHEAFGFLSLPPLAVASRLYRRVLLMTQSDLAIPSS